MRFSTFVTFALLGVSNAMPANTILGFDDLLFLREDGNHQVMKKWEYQIQEDIREVQRRKALGNAPRNPTPSPEADLRDRCLESLEVQITSDTKYEGDDIPMSPVVGNQGSSTAIVAVSKGYSVANTLEITTTNTASVYSMMEVSLAIAVGVTWTTTDTQTFSYYVPTGQYGLVISNPYIRRIEGNTLSGCTDSPTVEPLLSETYTATAFGALEWVKGPITMCNSTTYPIPFCTGDGEHK